MELLVFMLGSLVLAALKAAVVAFGFVIGAGLALKLSLKIVK